MSKARANPDFRLHSSETFLPFSLGEENRRRLREDPTFALTTMCKGKRGDKLSYDNIQRQLHLAIRDQTSAELAVLHLMDDFDFDLEELKANFDGYE